MDRAAGLLPTRGPVEDVSLFVRGNAFAGRTAVSLSLRTGPGAPGTNARGPRWFRPPVGPLALPVWLAALMGRVVFFRWHTARLDLYSFAECPGDPVGTRRHEPCSSHY